MLTKSTRYRWQDHAITPRRAATNLKASALIVAGLVIAADLFGAHRPEAGPAPHAAVMTERTPSLAHLVKRPVPPHSRSEALSGG